MRSSKRYPFTRQIDAAKQLNLTLYVLEYKQLYIGICFIRFIYQASNAQDFQNKSRGKKLWGINRKADDTAQCYLSIKLIEWIYLIITDSSWTFN